MKSGGGRGAGEGKKVGSGPHASPYFLRACSTARAGVSGSAWTWPRAGAGRGRGGEKGRKGVTAQSATQSGADAEERGRRLSEVNCASAYQVTSNALPVSSTFQHTGLNARGDGDARKRHVALRSNIEGKVERVELEAPL